VARVAVNNDVTMAEARKLLSSKELAEFKWDVNQYIEAGKKHGSDPVWMKKLENASARFHISKLEALQIRTQQALETAFGNETDVVDSMIRKTYSEGYYRTLYEVQKGFGTGWEVGQLDQRKIDKIVSSPWSTDGKNFSSRIWDRKSQMIGELQNQLVQTCVLGKTADDAAKSLEQFVDGKIKNANNAARRLVMTEQAFFHSESQKEAFKELGVEQYEIVATLDSKTSEICQNMDGEVFDMKDFESGVTAPPFHVYCRSVVAPYFPDDFGEIGQRAARDEVNDKTYYVPADMKYPEWKKAFVDGDTSGLRSKTNGDIIKTAAGAFEAAKTVADAIAKTNEYAKTVDLNGIKNLDSLNSMNHALDDLTSKYEINELQEIEGFSREKALAKANYRHLLVRKSFMNKPNDSKDDWSEIVEDYKKRIDEARKLLDSGTLTSRSSVRNWKRYLDSLENEIKFTRYGVSDSYEDRVYATICHEFGHVIADQYCGQINGDRAWKGAGKLAYSIAQEKKSLISDTFRKAKDTGDIYKISKYASTNSHEFFAEVFAARELGEELPDYIVEMLERVIQ
jgi:SPP1 gp7 family putative phage head morphogenesis protein